MKKKCHINEKEICDFCLHFLVFRDEDGFIIDGSGYCGLKREIVYIGDSGCKNFYCKLRWRDNMRKLNEGEGKK